MAQILLRESEAAEYLNFQKSALQVWRLNGKGPRFVRVSKRAIRYRPEDLDAFIEARLASHTAEVTEAERAEGEAESEAK